MSDLSLFSIPSDGLLRLGDKSVQTIKKCFRKAGILNQSFQVVNREVPTEDPLLDLDVDEGQLVRDDEMQDLINQLQVENPCSADELALIENLAVCADLTDGQWEVTFFTEIGSSSSKSVHTKDIEEGSDVEPESDGESTELPSPRFQNLPVAPLFLLSW